MYMHVHMHYIYVCIYLYMCICVYIHCHTSGVCDAKCLNGYFTSLAGGGASDSDGQEQGKKQGFSGFEGSGPDSGESFTGSTHDPALMFRSCSSMGQRFSIRLSAQGMIEGAKGLTARVPARTAASRYAQAKPFLFLSNMPKK